MENVDQISCLPAFTITFQDSMLAFGQRSHTEVGFILCWGKSLMVYVMNQGKVI